MWMWNFFSGKELSRGIRVQNSGPNNKEVAGGKIEFYDAKRHNLHHHPPVIIAMIKSDNVI